MQRATIPGLLAILIWSTSIAFTRRLSEQLGVLTTPMLVYTLAGVLACCVAAFSPGGLGRLLRLPRLYLWGCGALFVAYTAAFYLAIGLAATRAQVIVAGLVNYLWPALSLLFSIPILHKKARPGLPVGVALALAGVWLAVSGGQAATLADAFRPGVAWISYALMLFAAVCWALYSNLARRWAGETKEGAVPLFLLASGLAIGLARLAFPEPVHFSPAAGLELAYMVVFPSTLAYIFWDLAVRRGQIILVASLSYLIPLLSTLVSMLVLGVSASPLLWAAALLVAGGAVVCRQALPD